MGSAASATPCEASSGSGPPGAAKTRGSSSGSRQESTRARAATAAASLLLHQLTADARYRDAAARAVATRVEAALDNPLAHGTTATLAARLAAPSRQIVVVTPDAVTPDVGAGGTGAGGTRAGGVGTGAGAGPAGGEGDDRDDRDAIAWCARRVLVPGSLAVVVSEGAAAELADAGFELFAGRTTQQGRATAYLCRDFTCRLPVTDLESFEADLAVA